MTNAERKNQKGNKKILWDKQIWKHNMPKLWDAGETVLSDEDENREDTNH